MPRDQRGATARAPDHGYAACTESRGSDVLRGAHILQDASHAHRHAHVSVEHVVANELGGAGRRALCSHGKRLLSRT